MRSGYLDFLRAMAILRVVVYHATGLAVLTVLFPAMGIMFAIAGSLMAASLDRSGWRAVGRRLRRLLPPLWAIAAFMVPAMLLTGLAADWRLALWVVPILDPPANEWGSSILGVVWYLRQYLWFVLLSPLLLWLFRRYPMTTLAAPLVLLAVVESGWAPGQLRDFGLYTTCWVLGYAHHDGLLRSLGRRALIVISGAFATAGLGWLAVNPGPRGYDLNDIPVAHALWSVAVVLALFGFAPAVRATFRRWSHGTKVTTFLNKVVTFLNQRAVTVYLWHCAVIVGLGVVAAVIGLDSGTPAGLVIWLVLVGLGVLACTAAFGWVEDLAARRRPALVPAASVRA